MLRAYLFLGLIEAAAAMSAFLHVLHQGGWSWGQMPAPDAPLYPQATTTATLCAIISLQMSACSCVAARSGLLSRPGSAAIADPGRRGARARAAGLDGPATPLGNAMFATAAPPASVWLCIPPFALLMYAGGVAQGLGPGQAGAAAGAVLIRRHPLLPARQAVDEDLELVGLEGDPVLVLGQRLGHDDGGAVARLVELGEIDRPVLVHQRGLVEGMLAHQVMRPGAAMRPQRLAVGEQEVEAAELPDLRHQLLQRQGELRHAGHAGMRLAASSCMIQQKARSLSVLPTGWKWRAGAAGGPEGRRCARTPSAGPRARAANGCAFSRLTWPTVALHMRDDIACS